VTNASVPTIAFAPWAPPACGKYLMRLPQHGEIIFGGEDPFDVFATLSAALARASAWPECGLRPHKLPERTFQALASARAAEIHMKTPRSEPPPLLNSVSRHFIHRSPQLGEILRVNVCGQWLFCHPIHSWPSSFRSVTLAWRRPRARARRRPDFRKGNRPLRPSPPGAIAYDLRLILAENPIPTFNRVHSASRLSFPPPLTPAIAVGVIFSWAGNQIQEGRARKPADRPCPLHLSP